MLPDAISARNITKPTDAIMSTGFAPSISVSRKRPVNRAPAIPGITPAATAQQQGVDYAENACVCANPDGQRRNCQSSMPRTTSPKPQSVFEILKHLAREL